MVISLEWGADLHMAKLMPLPLTVSCFIKIQVGFTFLVPAHLGSSGQRTVKRVCVCVCISPRYLFESNFYLWNPTACQSVARMHEKHIKANERVIKNTVTTYLILLKLQWCLYITLLWQQWCHSIPMTSHCRCCGEWIVLNCTGGVVYPLQQNLQRCLYVSQSVFLWCHTTEWMAALKYSEVAIPLQRSHRVMRSVQRASGEAACWNIRHCWFQRIPIFFSRPVFFSMASSCIKQKYRLQLIREAATLLYQGISPIQCMFLLLYGPLCRPNHPLYMVAHHGCHQTGHRWGEGWGFQWCMASHPQSTTK